MQVQNPSPSSILSQLHQQDMTKPVRFLNTFSINDIETHVKSWECPHCKSSLLSSLPFSQIDNDELSALSFNSNFSCKCQSSAVSLVNYSHLDRLETCKLAFKEHEILFKNDVDTNMENSTNFNYYDNHEFHKLAQKLFFNKNKTSGILHTNISSIRQNLENLQTLLCNLDYKFDILALTETWHTQQNDASISQLSLDGYHDYQGLKGSSLKGGCGFFIADYLSFLRRDDLSKVSKDKNCEFESLWIEINNPKGKNTIIGVAYKHPCKDSSAFLGYLQNVLNKISRENKLVILSGDFNLNLLKFDKIPCADSFLNLMLANFLKPLITQPTRINDTSTPSLIDNIFINSLQLNAISGNLIDKVSDHLPNFAIYDTGSKNSSKDTSMSRDYRNFISEKYLDDINNTDFNSSQINSNDLNIKYNVFQSQLITIINKHAPLKPKTKRQRKQLLKPWISNGILKSISSKNSLYKKFIKTKDNLWFQRYKTYRNKLNQVIRLSKKLYHLSYFETFKNDSKKIWRGINGLLHKNKTKNRNNFQLNIAGNLLSDRKSVANAFNHFFTNIAQNLVDKLSPAKSHYKDYLLRPNAASFFVSPVDPSEVLNELLSLNDSKAPDAYDIPVKLIKCISNSLKQPLTNLINESFSSGSQKDCIKYLGVLLDKDLSWKQHIQQVKLKISKGIGILAKIRHYVPQQILRNLYFAFIQPHVNYALINWGSANLSSLIPVGRNLNKAIKIMNFNKNTASSKPIFHKFGILNLDDSYTLQCAKFMYDINTGTQVNNFFCKLFQKTTSRHSYNTRQAARKKFAVPRARTNLKKRLITFNGVKIWNDIPLDIRSKPNKRLFQKHLRNWLLQKYL
ncbi:hypothetical protein GQR58_014551 [Nymphon striatum]|nr:hypothetical protein GQR58_014551 [Nymphon striatum]